MTAFRQKKRLDAMTKSKLTETQLRAWAATRVRMLVARLLVMLVRGEVIPYERM